MVYGTSEQIRSNFSNLFNTCKSDKTRGMYYELGKPFYGFHYKFLEPSEHEETLNLITEYLLPALDPLGYDPQYPEDFREFFKQMMEGDTHMSYIAVHMETGEIAACRMVDLVEKGVESDLTVPYPPYFKHKSNIDNCKLITDICKDVDLFEEYNVTKYPYMFGLCVKEKYRMKGIAGEMYRRGLNFLHSIGYKIVKCCFVNPYTRKAGHKNGFVELNRRYYHECKNEEGEILNPNSDPTDFIDFGVFDLRKGPCCVKKLPCGI